MLYHWHCSTSCHRKQSISGYNRTLSQHTVITSARKRRDNGINLNVHLLEWKVTFEDTMLPRHDRHGDTCCTVGHLPWEIFRVFLFAENGRSNRSQNNWTTSAKWLTTGWVRGTMHAGSWAPWPTFLFSKLSLNHCLRFNVHTLMLHHILILCHI